VTLQEAEAATGIELDLESFRTLRLALTESLIKNRKFDTLEIEKQTDLVTYISRFKKGSKRFRKFLKTTAMKKSPVSKSQR
jgi:hypothetical protein